MTEYIEFESADELLRWVLCKLHNTFKNEGLTSLRGLGKNKELNRDLKRIKEEYFPLALYLKTLPEIIKISIPIETDNPGFDARISTQKENFYIEITGALLTHEGKAIKDQFKTENNKLAAKDKVNKEIKRIKYAIKNKQEKSEKYEENRPVLLVAFGNINQLTCITEEECNFIDKKIQNFIKWAKKKLKKCFSKIVLIKFFFDPFYVKELYESEEVVMPEKYKIFTITYELDTPVGINSLQRWTQPDPIIFDHPVSEIIL